MENSPLRRQILDCAKNFKTSWVELGRAGVGLGCSKSLKAMTWTVTGPSELMLIWSRLGAHLEYSA